MQHCFCCSIVSTLACAKNRTQRAMLKPPLMSGHSTGLACTRAGCLCWQQTVEAGDHTQGILGNSHCAPTAWVAFQSSIRSHSSTPERGAHLKIRSTALNPPVEFPMTTIGLFHSPAPLNQFTVWHEQLRNGTAQL